MTDPVVRVLGPVKEEGPPGIDCVECRWKHLSYAKTVLGEMRDIQYATDPIHRAELCGALVAAEVHCPAGDDDIRMSIRNIRKEIDGARYAVGDNYEKWATQLDTLLRALDTER